MHLSRFTRTELNEPGRAPLTGRFIAQVVVLFGDRAASHLLPKRRAAIQFTNRVCETPFLHALAPD